MILNNICNFGIMAVSTSFSDRSRYTLQHFADGSLIVAEPIGWREDDKEYSRHKTYRGVISNFSNNLGFIKEGKQFIINVYDAYGINAKLRLIKDEKHPKSDVWTRIYDGYLDFSTLSVKEDRLEIRFNSGGLETLLKTRNSERLFITKNESMDGLPLNELSVEKVKLEGRKIFLESKIFSGTKGIPQYKTDDDKDRSKGEEVRIDMEVYKTNDLRTHTIPFPLPEEEYTSDTSVSTVTPIEDQADNLQQNDSASNFFYDDADRDRKIKVLFDLSFIVHRVKMKNISSDNSLIFKVLVAKYNDEDSDHTLDELTYLYDDPDPMHIDKRKVEIKTTKEFSLKKGQNLALLFCVQGVRWFGAFWSSSQYTIDIKNIHGSLIVQEDSYFKPTVSKVILPYEACERLIELISGKKAFRSNFFGRKDIERNNTLLYNEDGPGAYLGIAHGLWIRGFSEGDDVYKPPMFSLDDFLKTYFAVHNLGMGIEKRGFEEIIRVEPASYFFDKNVTIRLSNPVRNIVRSVAKEHFYSGVDIGYQMGAEYEEIAGLHEYNAKSTFSTTIVAVKNKLSQVSPFRADGVGIEIARRKPKAISQTEDTRFDEHIFLLDMKKDNTDTLKMRKWQEDFEVEPTVYDPDSAINLRITPLNNLFRHGWVLRAGLEKYLDQKTRFINATGNISAVTQLKGQEEYAEKGDVPNDAFLPPRYSTEWIEFEHVVDFNTWRMISGAINRNGVIKPNLYGLIEFIDEFGSYEQGFLFSLKPNGSGKWKVLKASKVAERVIESQPAPDLKTFNCANAELKGFKITTSGVITLPTVSEGTIISTDAPASYNEVIKSTIRTITAKILVPSGYSNSGQTIECSISVDQYLPYKPFKTVAWLFSQESLACEYTISSNIEESGDVMTSYHDGENEYPEIGDTTYFIYNNKYEKSLLHRNEKNYWLKDLLGYIYTSDLEGVITQKINCENSNNIP